MRPRISIPVLLALSALTLAAAERPPGAMKAGVVITAEGGVEGTQVYRYDAEGRPLDGTPAKSRTITAPRPAGSAPAAANSSSAAPAPAPVPKQSIKTADGRTVPFTIEGKGIGKSVDDAVDFNSALKKASKSSGLMEQRFEKSMSTIGKEQVYSRNNLVTLDTWHGRYDTIGRKKSDIELKDTLGAPVRPKDTVEVKSVDRIKSAVSGTKAEVKDWEERMGIETNAKFTGVKSNWQGKLNPDPKTVDQLSMQDINRYQFRRNRSSDPGLPVVKPGSDDVQSKGGKK
ncbi:MAG: hypothetical protein NTU71_06990 [Verrucomicrobia bacterium]|nr:hypothetical protein [Verrucomicrobiota bacterium]